VVSTLWYRHCGIDVDLSKFALRHLLLADGQSDRFFEQPDQLLDTNALTPLGQRGGMQRQFVLHRGEAAEVLPVRVFDPAVQQRLVRFVEGMLQVMQPDQQANRLGWRAEVRAVTVGQRRLETAPVDLVRQDEQRMTVIEQLLELSPKQIELTGFRSRFGLHADLKLQVFDPSRYDSLQF